MDLTTKNYIKNNLSYKTTYIFDDLNLNLLDDSKNAKQKDF